MRRLALLAAAAGLAVLSAVGVITGDMATTVRAAPPITFLAHVHDNYFHPTGGFVVGPGHATAQALCMGNAPDSSCTATIKQGDSVQWVAPAPLAVNPHSVTECTDGTWTVCGPGVSAANPIEDSGVLFQPGWPYTVGFNTPGTYYYRCQVHPSTMRGVVEVVAGVGGGVDLAVTPTDGGGVSPAYIAAASALALAALGGFGLLTYRRLSQRAM